jgi:hypothetical protein
MSTNKIFIPYYISNNTGAPAQVLPRVFFYNGLKESDSYWIQHWTTSSFGKTITAEQYSSFPYFDNYSGQETTTSSLSLLFLNEDPVYGDSAPSQSLYDLYWAKYVDLLYNPRTRIIRLSAVLPFPVYQKLELNDIIQLRSNYYHLRAINDYNLRTGECRMELLGPLLEGALNLFPTYYSTEISANVQRNNCDIGYTGSFSNIVLPASYSVSTASQTDAQNNAQLYFNSISQSEANASGSCILDSTYYATYSFALGLSYDNNVTTSIYPLTVSFYTTTSAVLPSESSSQWTVIGNITSSNSLEGGRQNFTVTARKNFDLNNPYSSSNASGSFYNFFKVRGAGGEYIGLGSPYNLPSIDSSGTLWLTSSWYGGVQWYNTTSSQVYYTNIQSRPHLNNNYTQSLRLRGEFEFEFYNGINTGSYMTGSVAGPLTMSWLVTSSTTFPSISDSKWTSFAIMSQSFSKAQILTQVTGSLVYVGGSVYGTSSLYTTSNQIYYFKVVDAAGLRPSWTGVSRTVNDITLTRTYNAFPNTDMVSFRVDGTGSLSDDQNNVLYFIR